MDRCTMTRWALAALLACDSGEDEAAEAEAEAEAEGEGDVEAEGEAEAESEEGEAESEAAPESCLVADACCVLARQEGAEEDEAREGAAGCVGEDLDGGDWGGEDALEGAGLQSEDGVLTLRPSTVTRVPVVWVTSTNENKVAKFDSVTGQELLRVPTWGWFPNRTAVAADGSVWITDRDSYQYVHISAEGDLLCSSPQGYDVGPGYTRGAAIDRDGFAWIALNDRAQVIKVHPSETDGEVEVTDMSPDQLGTVTVPRCREIVALDLVDEGRGLTTHPYGLAADGEGFLWAGVSGGEPVAKIDAVEEVVVGLYDVANDPTLQAYPPYPCWSMYGMTLDLDGNPWFANMGCGSVVKLDRATGAVAGVYQAPPDETTGYGMVAPRAAGIDRRGHVWVADNGWHDVHEFAPDGTWVKKVDVSSCGDSENPGTLGTGSDLDGNMWTVLQNVGRVVKYTVEGELLGCYPEDMPPEQQLLASPYTYSDLTGSTFALVTSQLGRWRGRVDHDSPLHWLLVAYRASAPEGTGVCVRVRAAETAEALGDASFSSRFCEVAAAPEYTVFRLEDESGAPLPGLGDAAHLEIELQLSSTDPDLTPAVSDLSVAARAP